MEDRKAKDIYFWFIPALLLLLMAGFWYKLSLRTQSQNKNQPARVNNGRMLSIISPDFSSGETIPSRYTCDGENVNPALKIEGVLEDAKSLALIIDDPDAPGGTWNHWALWNIDPAISEIDKDSIPSGSVQGTNSSGRLAYGGPCPPTGKHRYFFKLYALDSILDLPEGAEKDNLEKAMDGHVLEEANLIGEYERLR